MKTWDFSTPFDVNEIAKEVEALIAKHYKGLPMSVVVDTPLAPEGFFLMFAKKSADGNVSVRTFGNSMSIGQIMDAFDGVLQKIEQSERRKIPVA